MQKRHLDKFQYFKEQAYTTKKYIIPYIENHYSVDQNSTILEIGCGEGGNLLHFMEVGCNITGIDLSVGKIEKGNEFYLDHKNNNNLTLIADDIYNQTNLGTFDIIILRDVIEHIPDQLKFMGVLKNFMTKNSVVFFGFPPWQNPFGGHQQVCKSSVLSKLPWFHLFPKFIYRGILKLLGESSYTISGLLEIKETGISIERFERILKQQKYRIDKKTIFVINPNYEVKFGLKPRQQINLIASFPWLRNFLSTAAYYLVSANENSK